MFRKVYITSHPGNHDRDLPEMRIVESKNEKVNTNFVEDLIVTHDGNDKLRFYIRSVFSFSIIILFEIGEACLQLILDHHRRTLLFSHRVLRKKYYLEIHFSEVSVGDDGV